MLTVIYLHADAGNLGDRLTEIGAKYLLHRVLGWHPFYTVSFRNPELIQGCLPADAIVLIGTPWFWDGYGMSDKYQMLVKLCSLCVRIRAALGIGSNYPLKALPETESSAWAAFDLVVARDVIAQHLAGSQLLCCPSLFCAQALGIQGSASHRRVLVYADMDCGSISSSHLTAEEKAQFNDYQSKLIQDRVPVITMTPLDSAAFAAHYGYAVPYFDSPALLLNALLPFKEIISARVHACAAALSLGRAAQIWPVDTRALTVVGCGAEPLLPLPPTPPITQSLEAWLDTLRQTFGG